MRLLTWFVVTCCVSRNLRLWRGCAGRVFVKVDGAGSVWDRQVARCDYQPWSSQVEGVDGVDQATSSYLIVAGLASDEPLAARISEAGLALPEQPESLAVRHLRNGDRVTPYSSVERIPWG